MSREPLAVTGGAGFIGANLVTRLCRDGHPVTVLDDLSKGRTEYLEGSGATVIEGSISDPEATARAFEGVDCVIHLAAAGSVVDSVTSPEPNFDANVRGTFDVLRAAVDAGATRVVFASTGGAIMGDTSPPVNEDSLPWPISPYGASKLAGEAYCHAFAGSFGLRCVMLRFANVYGPYSAHKKGVITQFLKSAMTGDPMVIYGDGAASRDFLYVDDLCDGIVAAVELEDPNDEIYHLALGVEVTISELADLVRDISGRPDIEIRYEDRRVGEVERTFANAERARERLGFEPRYDLRTGMQATLDWFRENVSV